MILAVCSKNEEHVAKEVFEKHPEMVLRLDDISCFVANWTDKAANLRKIAKTLNIGLDFARLRRRQSGRAGAGAADSLPEVAVPELPEDPAGYVQRDRAVSATSRRWPSARRTCSGRSIYRANAAREQALTGSANVDDFLTLAGRWSPGSGRSTPMSLERSAQLINKSNQFNLTTRRRSAAEVLALDGRLGVAHAHRLFGRPFRRQRPDQRAAGEGGRRRAGDRHLADELPRAQAWRGNAA